MTRMKLAIILFMAALIAMCPVIPVLITDTVECLCEKAGVRLSMAVAKRLSLFVMAVLYISIIFSCARMLLLIM